jgi:hypothetical protein
LEIPQRFYADITNPHRSFVTPEILEIREVNGTAMTIKRELRGKPLKNIMSLADESVPEYAVGALTTVLRELAAVPPMASMRAL